MLQNVKALSKGQYQRFCSLVASLGRCHAGLRGVEMKWR
jgi:hypothetical protein